MTAPVGLADLPGLWRRPLIAWPDGRRDEATEVYWLQGPSLYADVRVPPGRPDFSGATTLNDLDWPHIRWLATQEGFAGRLTFDGAYFAWQRALDFQPSAATPDAGRLWFADGMMIEEGRYLPYIEHWHRDGAVPDPCAAVELINAATGQSAILVRAGAWLMLARGRSGVLPPGGSLQECVDTVPIEQARKLIDFEISIAAQSAEGWRIVKSSLPFRESRLLDIAKLARDWRIVASEGNAAAIGL